MAVSNLLTPTHCTHTESFFEGVDTLEKYANVTFNKYDEVL